MVTINDHNEQAFLNTLESAGEFWTSGSRIYAYGEWKWETGDAWNYTNWDVNQARNTGCLFLRYIGENQFLWWGTDCNNTKIFICEHNSSILT